MSNPIRRAWWSSTSSDPEGWSTENRAWGQCAVTALIVQDLFGGTLRRGLVNGQSHYWNRLPDGHELDLTFEQFPDGSVIEEATDRERDYVLSNSDTRHRYYELRRGVAREMEVPD